MSLKVFTDRVSGVVNMAARRFKFTENFNSSANRADTAARSV